MVFVDGQQQQNDINYQNQILFFYYQYLRLNNSFSLYQLYYHFQQFKSTHSFQAFIPFIQSSFDIYNQALIIYFTSQNTIYSKTHLTYKSNPSKDNIMFIIDGLVAVMPIIGLYSQYALIKQRKHIGSFSIDTCGVLILSSILRIMFWFSKGFAVNLLIQSFLIIAMSFALLALCIQVGYNKNNSLTDLTGQSQQGFWRWKSIGPFSTFQLKIVVSTVFFTTFMSIMTAFFVHFDVKPYGQVIGLVAIGIQCCLGFPQLYQNQRSKSVEGLSLFMIACWFFGDFFKTLYFIVMLQPTQFIVGGAIQLAVDVLIVVQIMAFRESYTQLPSAKIAPQLKDEIQTKPSQKDYRLKSCDGI